MAKGWCGRKCSCAAGKVLLRTAMRGDGIGNRLGSAHADAERQGPANRAEGERERTSSEEIFNKEAPKGGRGEIGPPLAKEQGRILVSEEGEGRTGGRDCCNLFWEEGSAILGGMELTSMGVQALESSYKNDVVKRPVNRRIENDTPPRRTGGFWVLRGARRD